MSEQIRNIEINGTSPKEDILAALTGIWSVTEVNGWTVVHISGKLEQWYRWCNTASSYLLPRKTEVTLMAKIFNNDGTVSCSTIRIGEKALQVTKPCYVEIMVPKHQ